MIIPAPILSWYELSKIRDPKKVAVAPKLINTIEKPTANKIIGNIFTVFFLYLAYILYYNYNLNFQ